MVWVFEKECFQNFYQAPIYYKIHVESGKDRLWNLESDSEHRKADLLYIWIWGCVCMEDTNLHFVPIIGRSPLHFHAYILHFSVLCSRVRPTTLPTSTWVVCLNFWHGHFALLSPHTCLSCTPPDTPTWACAPPCIRIMWVRLHYIWCCVCFHSCICVLFLVSRHAVIDILPFVKGLRKCKSTVAGFYKVT